MRRRVLTIVSALSLLLCVGTCVLWVRSYWVMDSVGSFRNAGDIAYLSSLRGELSLIWSNHPEHWGQWHYQAEPLLDLHGEYPSRITPIRTFALPDPRNPWARGIEVSDWSVVLLLGLAPAGSVLAGVRRRRHGARRAAGHCPSCGYDLRATPDRCPECGRKADKVTR